MSAPAWLAARPIAHRGLHDRARGIAENTISAAEAAIAGGYAIECDVQLSADGEAVVFHDFDLDRLTGRPGAVGDLHAAALGALPVGGGADTIPTLPAFLDAIAGGTGLVIELKSRFDGDERLARRVVDILGERTGDRVVVKSFDPDLVILLRRLAPAIARGIVGQSRYDGEEAATYGPERCRRMTELLHWTESRPDFVSWRHADLPAGVPYLARALGGVPLISWTVRNEAERTRLAAHADQIVFEGFVPA